MKKDLFYEKFIEIVSIMKNHIGIKNAIVRELKGKKLITKAYFGYGEKEANIEIMVGSGVTGLCALNRKTIVINDLTTYKGEYIKGISNARSEICIPIFKNDELVGTFNIESDIINNFTEDKVLFLENLVPILGKMFGENDNENIKTAMNLAKSYVIFSR